MTYFMILLVGFLYYAVGIRLTDDAFHCLWFVLILLLLCLFYIVWIQVGDVSLGEDEEILQQLLFFLRPGGSGIFYLSCPVVLLIALVPI